MMRIWPWRFRQGNRDEDKKWAEMQQKVDDLRAVIALLESNLNEMESSHVVGTKEK
jgi:hypothetical protein